jgi:hypothetical protein
LGLIIAAVVVHSMVEFPLWYGIVLFPFGVILGALNRSVAGERKINVSRSMTAAVFVGGLMFVAAASWDYTRVVLAFATLELEQQPSYRGPVYTNKPEFSLYSQFFDYCHVAKVNVTSGMDPDNIVFLERVSLRFGFPAILTRLALAYAYNHRQNEALQVLISIKYLHSIAYESTYKDWAGYAKQDPNFYSPLFDRMPKPNSAKNE